MKIIFLVLVCTFLSFHVKGQECYSEEKESSESVVQEMINSEKLVINLQLVKSIQDYECKGKYIRFIDVYNELRGAERTAFFREYLQSSLENETLEDIKDRVIQEYSDNTTRNEDLTEEDIEWFMKVKANYANKETIALKE